MKSLPHAIALLLALAMAGTAHAESLTPTDMSPVTWQPAPQHAPVVLVQDGQAKAVVYVADPQPTTSLKLLLAELVEVIKLSSGAELSVVAEPPAAEQPAIIIGDGPQSRAAGIDAAAIAIDGFVIKTQANRVYLVGSTQPLPRNEGITDVYSNDGAAYAVADFLERFVGVRWYWPTIAGGRTIERHATLAIAPAHYRDQPVFRMRQFFPDYGWKLPAKARWFDKQPLPFPPAAIPAGVTEINLKPYLPLVRGGNSWPYLIKVHQPQHFMGQYDQWIGRPQLFQKKPDGTPDLNMLCYSSPETLAYLLEGCADAWDRGKAAAAPWVTTASVTVSPGDYSVDCHCPPCQKTMAEGGAPLLVGRFVKQMGEQVKQRWPGKQVIYLPYYNYQFCPEKVEFPDNVQIMVCTTYAPMALTRQPVSRSTTEKNVRAWSKKIGGPITTWDYSDRGSGWTHGPVQYPHLVQDFYKQNQEFLAGSFLNGGIMSDWTTSAPTLYVWMRVMWNPDLNVDAVLDEMCKRLYGKAAPAVRELLQLQCDRWQTAKWNEELTDAGHVPPKLFAEIWPPEVVAKMQALRQRAQQEMKGDPAAEQRFAYWTWTFDAFVADAKNPPNTGG